MFHINKFVLEDLKAGLVVSFVALPLCLGIALASGAPAISGILAGIIGGVIIGSLSPSQISVSGPAAGLTIVVLDAISDMGSFSMFLPALILAGFIQILMGLFKLGKVSNLIHHCVIEGMLSAIGLIIIIKQIPYTIGALSTNYSEILKAPLTKINLGAFIIGGLCLTLSIAHSTTTLKNKKFFKIIPISMLLVLTASTLAFVFSFFPNLALSQNLFVNLSGLTGGLQVFSSLVIPDFSQALGFITLKYGIIIALVASLETLLCIKAADAIDPMKRFTSPNKELFAQGIGNSISGLLGGLPLTSVIIRTSVNTQAGARTRCSSIFHGLILLLGLLAFPTLITKIPLAALACILVVAGYNLIEPKQIHNRIKMGYSYYVPFFITLIVIVMFDILIGVLAGQITSMIIKNIKSRQ